MAKTLLFTLPSEEKKGRRSLSIVCSLWALLGAFDTRSPAELLTGTSATKLSHFPASTYVRNMVENTGTNKFSCSIMETETRMNKGRTAKMDRSSATLAGWTRTQDASSSQHLEIGIHLESAFTSRGKRDPFRFPPLCLIRITATSPLCQPHIGKRQ